MFEARESTGRKLDRKLDKFKREEHVERLRVDLTLNSSVFYIRLEISLQTETEERVSLYYYLFFSLLRLYVLSFERDISLSWQKNIQNRGYMRVPYARLRVFDKRGAHSENSYRETPFCNVMCETANDSIKVTSYLVCYTF